MQIKTLSNEVHQAEGRVVWATKENIEFLKQYAEKSTKNRSRILAHPDGQNSIHEMIVCLGRDTYIHPHIHPGKTESFHLVEGRMNVVLFEEDGEILQVVKMGDLESGLPCYYRQTEPIYHTIIPQTDYVTFTEVTPGPFDPDDLVHAEWAPAEADDGKLVEFIKDLDARTRGD
jgi:cupin fold WbuC family metalloprotein